MKNQKPWTIRASAAGELEVMLYDDIGESLWGEGTTAKKFDADLKAAGNVSRIKLRINSSGGSVWDGLAIHNTLRSHGAAISATVDGLAASIASVILMAADVGEISIAPNAFVMVHNPATVVAGDENEFRKMADTLAKVKDSMVTSYLRHSSLSSAKIRAAMDQETWYSADEAVAAGFADEIKVDDEDEDEDRDEDMAAVLRSPIYAKFRNPPAGLAARLALPRRESRPPASESEKERLQLRVDLLRRL